MPTLAAVYRGDAAARLVASGGATADGPPAAPADTAAAAGAAPEALLASAAAPAAGSAPTSPEPSPPVTRALVGGPAVPATPSERSDDEAWTLPGAPAELVWRHPAPAAGLQVELLEARGRSWPSRVRVEADGDRRVATLVPLEPLPAGTEFRLVARVVAADGQSLLWTEPLRVKAQD